jgi:hypothetical protein
MPTQTSSSHGCSKPSSGSSSFRIAVSSSADSDVQWLTDGEQDDYKPAYSPDGSQIAFFRVVDYVAVPAVTWKTTLSVMNADGSDVRALTSGDYNDTTPYWTRDGSNQIIFCRWGPGQQLYVTSPDATPGDERLVSDPMFGDRPWSSLQDGRILVTRELPLPTAPFLLTPNVGGEPVYQEISYPFEDTYLHHMTISPPARLNGCRSSEDFHRLHHRSSTSALVRFLDRSPCFFHAPGDHPSSEHILANELTGHAKHRLDVPKVLF